MSASEHDAPRRAVARAAQEDPWVEHLVVRRGAPQRVPELLELAVAATLEADARFPAEPEHAEAYRRWYDESFRKVTLRARPGQWERLLGGEAGGVALAGDPEGAAVACVVPARRSERHELLARMQAFAPAPADVEASPARGSGALFVVPAGLDMSLGKLMAQVGHAALMLLARTGAEAAAAWRAAGWPARFAAADPPRWAAIAGAPGAVVVRDAGLTEIAPGTRTVAAHAPGEAADRLAAELPPLGARGA